MLLTSPIGKSKTVEKNCVFANTRLKLTDRLFIPHLQKIAPPFFAALLK
jgi:hypothetical protein